MDLYYVGDPLEGTKWENLTFWEYYEEMSDEERQELKEHLESINAPFTWNVHYREEFYPREFSRTWRDIALMSKEQLKDYYYYNLRLDQIHREIHSQCTGDESLEELILDDLYAFGNPLEDTSWEGLTIQRYCIGMSDDERQKFKEYLESIKAPYVGKHSHLDWWTWRDIASTELEVVCKKFLIPGAYEYDKELGLYQSTEDTHSSTENIHSVKDHEDIDPYESLPF